MKNFTQKLIGILAIVFAISFNSNSQEIGEIYEGGYIFQINEDGTGLVADLQDLGQMNWNDAMSAAESATSQSYDGWYLPSSEELTLMYSTIGYGAPEGDVGNFEHIYYWSSSVVSDNGARYVHFGNGLTYAGTKNISARVRIVRAVTFEVSGCIDASANNFNADANTDDGSCCYYEPVSFLGNLSSYENEGFYHVFLDSYNGNGETSNGHNTSMTINGVVSEPSTYTLNGVVYESSMYPVYNPNVAEGHITWGYSIPIIPGEVYDWTATVETCSGGSSFSQQYTALNEISGCADMMAINYNPNATDNDGSCEYLTGCLDPIAINYNPDAVMGDDSCEYLSGCMDPNAINYNPDASMGDGSCEYTAGCMDPSAINFNPDANIDDGSCEFSSGCMDPNAINFNPDANIDDGSCEFSSGCMDLSAINFNPDANVDDGSCEFLPGCTDAEALNYNLNASEDDGSCIYEIDCSGLTSVLVEVTDGIYPYEVSWELGDFFTGSFGTTSACLEDGCISFKMYDSYGDGWNQSQVTISSEGGQVLLTGTLDDGSEGILFFNLNYEGDCGTVFGCTDSEALNYDDIATADDGSCLYPVSGCMDPSAINYNPNAFMGDDSCEYDNDPGCPFDLTLISTFSGEWDDEISLSITSSTNELVFALSQGYPDYGGYGVIEIIEGVSTYNAGDFNVCLNPQECYTIRMTDYYGDGWNGAYFTLNDETFSLPSGSEISYDYGLACEEEICTDSLYSYELSQNSNFGVSVIDFDSNQTLYSVAGGTTGEFCLNSEGCYIFQLSNSTGIIDSSNIDYFTLGNQEFYFDQGEVVGGGAYSEFDPYLTTFSDILEVGCITSGCTDSLSDNFDIMAVVNDGSCQLYEVGCMDSLAFNYNDQALLDDGSCEPFIEGCTDPSALNYNDFANTDDGACIPVIFGCTDEDSYNYNQLANTEDGSCEYPGCTNPVAINYDDSANVDDGSCQIEGCMDPTALNYNAEANTDNDSCISIIYGCTESSADNYYSLANFDNGNCKWYGCTNPAYIEYNELFNVNDGSCDILVVYGCIDENTQNYNELANLDDGSCIPHILGCTDNFYAEYNPNATLNDNSCETVAVFGCTDINMFNYDDLANVDDGSCIPFTQGCMDPTFIEFNGLANQDDGSCVTLIVYGCTIDSALNYNALANSNDGSCQIEGCMNPALLNYNEFANINANCDYQGFLLGCMYNLPGVCNYNPNATDNYDYCLFPITGENCDGEDCANTDNGATDSWGDGCDDYNINPGWCGNYNDDDFISEEMCCVCGGGSTYVPVVEGCTNPEALNFDPETTYEDGSCQYLSGDGYGCTDLSACNYDSNAEYDNGSCVYPEENYDCEGNCLATLITAGFIYTPNTFNAESQIGWQILSCDGGIILEGESPFLTCVDLPDNYSVMMTDSRGNGWGNGYLVVGDEDFYTLEYGYTGIESGLCSGCTNPEALNFDPEMTYDDGSCQYLSGDGYGCTDLSACNYDSNAEYDNGSCVYPEENYDCEGNCLATLITAGGGSWQNEIGWQILSCDESIILEGGAPFSKCTDLPDDYSVIMTDSWGDTWDGNYLVVGDDSYTIEEPSSLVTVSGPCGVMGCADQLALNYNPFAEIDDGSCIFVGCVDENAFNYDENANTGDGSCEYPGCTNPVAINYDDSANVDDGSCQIEGCMDPTALNYVAEANTEDGSCVSWEEFLIDSLQSELDNIVPEDGISQEDVDAASEIAFADGVASVELPECEEVATQNIPLDLPEGWSMFGYTCLESLYVIEAFSDISDNIEIVKDEWGLAYLPAWGFSAFSNLEFGEGYQIKMIEEVTDFQFCTTVTGR